MFKNSKIDFKIFKRLIIFVRDYKKLLLYSFVCTMVLAILTPLRPKLIGVMVDKYIISSVDPKGLLNWTLLIAFFLFLEGVFQFFGSFSSNLLAQSIIRDIRVALFRHLSSFRMKYFDKTSNGAIVSRLISDIEAISEVFSSGLLDILGDLLMLIVVICIMFASNWQLTLLTLIPIPLLIIATNIFAKAMRNSFAAERIQVTRLSSFVQERLSGMFIVQLFSREQNEMNSFEAINKGHRQAHVNAVWAFSIFFPVVEILSSLSIAFLLVWGAFQFLNPINNPKLMFSEIISFTLWIQMLFRPIRQLADKFNILQRGIVRAERVFEVLDLEEQSQKNGTIDSFNFNQKIIFQDLSFAYNDENWVLKNISLEIQSGDMVAFVGATGAGKSSLVNLLGRFYENQKGAILIGQTDIRDLQLELLRKNIAIVLQDVFLFSDSILNNVTLNDPSISLEEVIIASKAVGAHNFIEKLPGGYNYNIGERGGMLSVGQRQMLSFIRAYVYNPSILILDEATSSVDNESEKLIQHATEKITKGRTSIVIAHRLSTIQSASLIVVMDQGKIVEKGSHSSLIELKGYYKRLYDIQFSK